MHVVCESNCNLKNHSKNINNKKNNFSLTMKKIFSQIKVSFPILAYFLKKTRYDETISLSKFKFNFVLFTSINLHK